MNRLGQEKSPYLLQHRLNPVWWQPWDDEALAQATRENKPIFLSIGYSTCHWCHVMEHESFEDAEIAQLLNQHFVAIKVDREERPDLDDVYMTAVQQMTGHGGWPMSVWLTPERKPFFGGTYFPKANFAKLLERIHEIWRDGREKLIEDSQRVHEVIEQVSKLPAPDETSPVGAEVLKRFVADSGRIFEPKFGGFGQAPKFPQALMLMALMRLSRRMESGETEQWITQTLDHMHRGGMYDHLAGGFHRYSTDSEWLVPHFEKMLYDNALLAQTYCEAYQFFGEPEYARVTDEILTFVQREMTDAAGGFYSALDADSLDPEKGHKEEGFFATFTYSELEQTLTPAELSQLAEIYPLKREGHYEGRNILHLAASCNREDAAKINPILEKLRVLRKSRPAPHLDNKVITEWNGLMIAAFAKAHQVLGREAYRLAATRAAEFALTHLRTPEGRLLRRWREGSHGITAFADDYTALIHGLLCLYESDFNVRWLSEAEALQEKLDQDYWDGADQGYFRDCGQDATLIARIKDDYDGVTPTANSQAALNLLRLYGLTLNDAYLQRAEAILARYQLILSKAPLSLSQMISAVDFSLDQAKQIALVYRPGRGEVVAPLLRSLRALFLPNQVVAVAEAGSEMPALVRGRTSANSDLTAYLCDLRTHTCRAPIKVDNDRDRAALVRAAAETKRI